MRAQLTSSLNHALARLEPSRLVVPHLPERAPSLVVAVGKAALPMLNAARQAFPRTPWIAVPPAGEAGEGGAAGKAGKASDVGSVGKTPNLAADGPEVGQLLPGSHPLPDERSVRAGEAVLRLVGALGAEDRLLLLLSGGGSSLLAAPEGVTLEQKRAVVSDLMHAGANIHQLNTVRKHISRVKGGRLAAATNADILNLVISDVPGDDVGTVASGLASPDTTSFADALTVLDEFGLAAPAARRHLSRGAAGEVPENPGPQDPLWRRVQSKIVGSNKLLLEAAQEYWQAQGYAAVILSDRFEGEARDVARQHAQIVAALRPGRGRGAVREVPHVPSAVRSELAAAMAPGATGGRGVVLLSGGEATVTVTGGGLGGRNQEFALWLLRELREAGVWALSVGSDGIDGNSEAAGAVLTPDSWERAQRAGLDIDAYLRRNDSYAFFHALGDTVVTGLTGNNLNDYRVLVLER